MHSQGIKLTSLIFVIFSLATNLFADTIEMTNGDRLTGKIVKKEADKLFIDTEIAGTIAVKWSLVKQIISDASMAVTMEDGKTLEGKISPEANKLKIPGTEEVIEIDRTKIKIVRTPEAQKEYEEAQRKIQESRITDFWSGTVDVGFSLTSGNSDTRTFSAAMRGIRETPNNKIRTYSNAVQVKDTSQNIVRVRAQSVWAGLSYEADLNKKWFAYASGDFEYNKPQKLNLRAVLGSGFGLHAIKNDRLKLDVTVGFSNNYENFSTGLRRNSAELSLGQDLKFKLNSRSRLSERFVFYPTLTNLGEARALFDSSLETDINSWLGWHVTIGNRFNSRPVNLTEKNDFLLSTGLRFWFGKNRKKLPK